MSSPPPPNITLLSSDGQEFEISVAAASMSQYIKNMIEDDCADGEIYNVSGNVLRLIISYCNRHAEFSPADGSSGEVLSQIKVVSHIIGEYKEKLESGVDPGVDVDAMGTMLAQFIDNYKKINLGGTEGYKRGVGGGAGGDEMKVWDADFVKVVDVPTLFGLMKAASYLKIPSLLELTMQDLEKRFQSEDGEEHSMEIPWPFKMRNTADFWSL